MSDLLALTIPVGMKAYGPDHPDYPNAPRDWDNGPYLCRDGGMYHMRGYGWKHGEFCTNPTSDWDRVAYTPSLNAEIAGMNQGDTA
jgi:hypothetical protein